MRSQETEGTGDEYIAICQQDAKFYEDAAVVGVRGAGAASTDLVAGVVTVSGLDGWPFAGVLDTGFFGGGRDPPATPGTPWNGRYDHATGFPSGPTGSGDPP